VSTNDDIIFFSSSLFDHPHDNDGSGYQNGNDNFLGSEDTHGNFLEAEDIHAQ
jgi:hypothetical protein